jgi:D-glycero-alpha-D-manno-heptose-7-phosphate kinase
MVITRTPFRISFFGGGTDYPIWYRAHGGAVLGAAIDKYCYITCRYLPPFFAHHSRAIYSKIENVAGNGDFEHPSIRACLAHLGVADGVEIHHDADLPARTGLGTSSSFTVGLLHALHALRGEMRDRSELAAEAIHVEQVLLRENVGAQDQAFAAHGGFNLIRFAQDGTVSVQPVVTAPERLEQLQRHFLLFFTGFTRTASEIARQQIANTPQRQEELAAMQRLVDRATSVLTDSARPLAEFGALLDETWRLKRQLADNISNSALDEIYATACQAGALGGKLLGAGGGGFMLFFVPPECQARVRQALDRLLLVPFRFSASGSELIHYERREPFSADLARDRQRVYGHHA